MRAADRTRSPLLRRPVPRSPPSLLRSTNVPRGRGGEFTPVRREPDSKPHHPARARTSSLSSSMPRSVGTSALAVELEQAALQEGLRAIVLDPARGDPLEDPQAQEHLLEVGVRRLETFLAAHGDRAAPRPATGTPRAGGRSTSGARRGTSARRRQGPGTAAAPSTRGCAGTRSRASPSSRPRSGGSRRRAAPRTPRRTCRPAGRGRAPARSPAATFRPSAVAGSIVSAYALTCSGASATASSSVRSHESSPRRRAVDQVEVHVLVAGRTGGGERRAHALRRVHAFQRREHRPGRRTARPSRAGRTRPRGAARASPRPPCPGSPRS